MRRETVLVVDDDETCRNQCRSALEAAGFPVILADGAGPATLAARAAGGRRRAPDLAVIDYLMPDQDGLVTFDALRRHQPDLAGILLTGHTSLDVAVEALNRGFSQVVAKPIDGPSLLEAVEAALTERQTVLENSRLRALTRLYDSLNQLAAIRDPAELYECILALAQAETNAHRASLMLLDERLGALRVVAATGLSNDARRDPGRRLGEPVSGWVLAHGMVLETGPGKPLPQAIRDALQRPEITASISLPLHAGDEPLGVLNISRLDSDQGFQAGDVELATVLASDAALTIQRLSMMQHRARSERVATVGRLASTIIHDLRGPVTIIGGAAEMLEETNPGQREALGVIRREVGELERMCRQLLSFARDAAMAPADRFAAADLLRDATDAALATTSAPPQDVRLLLDDEAEIELSRAELTRVVTDVIESALTARRAESWISISCRSDGERVELGVIGEADRASDWWPELDEPTALAAGGAGLTLAILRYVVERHRGRVTVDVREPHYAIRMTLPERRVVCDTADRTVMTV